MGVNKPPQPPQPWAAYSSAVFLRCQVPKYAHSRRKGSDSCSSGVFLKQKKLRLEKKKKKKDLLGEVQAGFAHVAMTSAGNECVF